MDFIHLGSIDVALVITLGLMFCHIFSPRLLKYPLFRSLRFASFAGGAAVSYVFLHMLPSLIEAKEPLGHALSQVKLLSPLFDILIFIVALLGFNVYYGLECFAEYKAEKGGSQRDNYYLHLFMFSLYNFLITYTMPLRVQTSLFFAIIFTVTMGLHFILVDRRLNQYFPLLFERSGRPILLLALFAGWFVTAITNPINVELAGFMVAFLSGSVLYGVFREELPAVHGSKFLSFTLGLVLVGALLVWQARLGVANTGL